MMKLVRISLVLAAAASLAVPAAYAQRQLQKPVTSATAMATAKQLVDQGNVKADRGDIEGGISNYEQALKVKPDYYRAYFNLGVAYCRLGQPEEEAKYYSEAIKLQPTDHEAITERGLAYVKLGDHESRQKAEADFKQSSKINPRYARTYLGWGWVKQYQDNPKGALADYTQAIRLDPKFAALYLHRGVVYTELAVLDKPEGAHKLKQQAVSDFTQAIKLDSTFATAYNNRGAIRWELNDKKGALEDLRKAADLYQQQGLEDDYQQTTKLAKEYETKGMVQNIVMDYRAEKLRLFDPESGEYISQTKSP